MKFTEKDSGRKIIVSRGDSITFSLKETPASGYRWSLHSSEQAKIIPDTYKEKGDIGAEDRGKITLSFSTSGSFYLHPENTGAMSLHSIQNPSHCWITL